MKIVIPAKRSSGRVPDKNWRQFYGSKSLVDIKIEQLLKCVSPGTIYLSCDDQSKQEVADKYGINFLLRAPELASDDTPWPDAFRGIIEQVPAHEFEDIAWIEVINPLFSDFEGLFKKWEEVKGEHDSLNLATPMTKFLLTKNGKPFNFMPGKWHAMSQSLEILYEWDSVSIMSKRNMLYFSYPIGRKPFLHSTNGAGMDIDTMEEFELAQLLFERKYKNG